MGRAVTPRRMPPAILNAPSVMPNNRKIRLPPKANRLRVMAQVQAPRRAMRRRTAGLSRWVIARKAGTAVSGSTMNRTDVKIRNSSWAVFTTWSQRDLGDAILAAPLRLVHRLIGGTEHRVAAGVGGRD